MAAHILVLYNTPTDPAAFDRYYHNTHVPLANQLPGLRSYVVSRGAIGSQGGASSYYLIANLEFDSMEALDAARASTEGKATAADVPKFATGGVTILTYESQSV